MADRGDTHYSVPSLNLWFLVSSVLFLGTMVWAVIDDWDAEWKQYQRDFRSLELAKAQSARVALEAEGAIGRRDELSRAVYDASMALAAQGSALQDAERRAYELEEDRFKLEEDFKKAKSLLNWQVYGSEKAVLEGEKDIPQLEETELAAYREDVAAKGLLFEKATIAWEVEKRTVSDMRSAIVQAEKDLAAGAKVLTQVEERIEALAPGDIATQVADFVRDDLPGLEFIGPNLKVQKFIPAGITFDLNFTKKARIDMCSTCHMGIENDAFAGDAQPHAAHPRLDLFLSSKSPHPAKDFGCTVCHRGAGEGLSFQHSDHRPSNEEEARIWDASRHWHKQHHWDYPMLREQDVEAGCVQCHKTSMELIADSAPHVTKGYRLFEEKGCYACHKVDWFPTTRRPGPALTNLAAKLTPEFTNAWIADPRGFRPTTDMPHFFNLENWPEDEVVVTSEYGAGREIRGGEWNRAAVAAVTTFLYDRHPLDAAEPIPADVRAAADAERGREVMNLSGCFACHNTAPFMGETDVLPAISNNATERNQMGPNLRGVATKLNADWLYRWILDPNSYWPHTRMPNLRLSEADAMDITAYVFEDPDGIFTDTPHGWEGDSEYLSNLDPQVLREQARWYFQKDGRTILESRLESEWSDTTVLASKLGERLVMTYGCFSCHEITGMESMMPIGTELTSWGSKTVDKLDFGQHYLKEVADLPKLDHHYREGWLERKLLRPRVFDIDKVKVPKDRARMPSFGFSRDEAQAVATFVLGLVNDEVPGKKMEPTAEQAVSDGGMRAVRQNNCMACHVVDNSLVTFRNESGGIQTVRGVIQPLLDEVVPPSMVSMDAFASDREMAELNADEEVEEVIIKLLEAEPDYGGPGELHFLEIGDLVDVTPSRGGSFVDQVLEYYMFGTSVADESGEPVAWTHGGTDDQGVLRIEDVDGQVRPYSATELDKLRWTFAPPVLLNEGHKLRPDWFYNFLASPSELRKQMRVKMPTFTFDPGEAENIVGYFGNKARWEWHSRYARTLRLAVGRQPLSGLNDPDSHGWNMPADSLTWPIFPLANITEPGPGLSAEGMEARMSAQPKLKLDAATIRSIEAGYKADVLASFDKLKAWGDSQGFSLVGPLKRGTETLDRQTTSYLDERHSFLAVGESVGAEGVNCYQCHPNGTTYVETPISWAPSLDVVSARLRPDWVREWLWNPPATYVGTAMAVNFGSDEPQYQAQYPSSTNAEQIDAVMDWLYNKDRREADILSTTIAEQASKIEELEAQQK